MHAVIRTGGKQYRVAAQDVIRIEKIAGAEGDAVLFDEVLAVGSELGAPLVSGASVAGRVLAQARAEKIVVFKKKRRTTYRRKQGHRQAQTVVRIEEILTGGKKAPGAEENGEKEGHGESAGAGSKARSRSGGTGRGVRTETPAVAQPDGPPDDLKKLPGVGPATEKKLNALGITTYAQVAAFTAEDIERVDAALKLKGKIEQDDWPTLAKDLAGGD